VSRPLLSPPRAPRHSLGLPLWALLLALAACGSCPGGACTPGGPEGVATLTGLSGTLTLHRAGAVLPAGPGTALLLEDVLVTGPSGSALLRAQDGTLLKVGEDSRLRLSGTPGALRLHLEAGTLVSRTPPEREARKGLRLDFQVLTP
jgi:hypothetical protein